MAYIYMYMDVMCLIMGQLILLLGEHEHDDATIRHVSFLPIIHDIWVRVKSIFVHIMHGDDEAYVCVSCVT